MYLHYMNECVYNGNSLSMSFCRIWTRLTSSTRTDFEHHVNLSSSSTTISSSDSRLSLAPASIGTSTLTSGFRFKLQDSTIESHHIRSTIKTKEKIQVQQTKWWTDSSSTWFSPDWSSRLVSLATWVWLLFLQRRLRASITPHNWRHATRRIILKVLTQLNILKGFESADCVRILGRGDRILASLLVLSQSVIVSYTRK